MLSKRLFKHVLIFTILSQACTLTSPAVQPTATLFIPLIEPAESLTPVLPAALPSPTAVPPTADPSGWKVLQTGTQGPEVFALQYLLRFHGQNVTLNGIFDPQTKEALISFQSVKGLSSNGLVEGDQSWPVLISGAWVEKGDNGDPVFAVQHLL